MSDTERREWEAMVWKYFDKCMFSCSRCHLPEYPKFPKDKNRLDKTVTGRLYEQLFDIINYRMRLSRAIAEIYDKKTPAGGQTPEGSGKQNKLLLQSEYITYSEESQGVI